MNNSLSEGNERSMVPDRESGELTERPSSALNDLVAEVAIASGAKAVMSARELQAFSTIESRSDLRSSAANEATIANPDRGGKVEVETDVAKAWADLDASEFLRTRSKEQREASLERLAGNARQCELYAEALRARAPAVAASVAGLNAAVEQEARARAQEERRLEGERAAEARLEAFDAAGLERLAVRRREESERVLRALAAQPAVSTRAADRGASGESPRQAVERNQERLLAMGTNELAAKDAKEMVGHDLAALAGTETRLERQFAVIAMGESMRAQEAYKAELQRQAPEVAREAADALRADEQRSAARADLKVAEMAAGRPRAAQDQDANDRPLKRPIIEDELPDALRRRFLVTQERRGPLDRGPTEFRYRGGERDGQLAFSDVGKTLVTELHDRAVVKAMVEVVQAKNWKEVTVSGSEEFRRAAWIEASLAGLSVKGYEPRQADVRRLDELRTEEQPKVRNTLANSEREVQVPAGSVDVDVEALRTAVSKHIRERAPLDPQEAALVRAAQAKGDAGAEIEIRGRAASRTARDLAAVGVMERGQLQELASIYGSARGVDGDARAREILDNAGRQRLSSGAAQDVPPAQRPAARDSAARADVDAPATRHINGDEPSKGETRTLVALEAFLRKQGTMSEAFIQSTLSNVQERMRAQRVHVGHLVEHGAARYLHKESNAPSYFVTLKTAEGVQTVWGKNLESAIERGGVKAGELIVLANVGKQAVEVPSRSTADGRETTTWRSAQLNDWEVKPLGRLPPEQASAVQSASSRREPTLMVYDPKAERAGKRTDDRGREGGERSSARGPRDRDERDQDQDR